MFGEEEERHPLLTEYLRKNPSASYSASVGIRANSPDGDDGILGHKNDDESTEGNSFIPWTTCDEFRRCSCAVMSFILIAAIVGTGLVLFWFLWAWFVLYLDLPGVVTPIVWLCGFLAPLCLFRVVTILPRCTRGCCTDPLQPPDINAWKTHHLWNVRKKHVNAITVSVPALPHHIAEIISDFCFHTDMLVTARGRKLLGMYADSGQMHTVAEFTTPVTDVAVPNGDIRKVYVLVRREEEQLANQCRQRMCCREGTDPTTASTALIADAPNQAQGGNAAGGGDNEGGRSFLSNLPQWLWDPTQYVDMIICEYDLAAGHFKQASAQFSFQQMSNTALQQIKGIYYEPSYRLLMDNYRNKMVVSRDGEFIVFDKYLNNIVRRELISPPENPDDREQFLHLREYAWNSLVVVPPHIASKILGVVDRVEHTDSAELVNDEEVYVLLPFGDHALFVGNINTGWLRYLDFSHVAPISEDAIHHVEFSQDNQYLYMCLAQHLSLLSTNNFQPLLTVQFTDIDYTIPCAIVRTPPEEVQLMAMHRYYDAKARRRWKKQKRRLSERMRMSTGSDYHNYSSDASSDTSALDDDDFMITTPAALQPQPSINVVNESGMALIPATSNTEAVSLSPTYDIDALRHKLESISVIFSSTRVFVDPRMFLYRFPNNKCKVVTTKQRKRRELYDGGWLLDRCSQMHRDNSVGRGGESVNGGWHYVSLKRRPWNLYDTNFNEKQRSTHKRPKKKKSGKSKSPQSPQRGFEGGVGTLLSAAAPIMDTQMTSQPIYDFDTTIAASGTLTGASDMDTGDMMDSDMMSPSLLEAGELRVENDVLQTMAAETTIDIDYGESEYQSLSQQLPPRHTSFDDSQYNI